VLPRLNSVPIDQRLNLMIINANVIMAISVIIINRIIVLLLVVYFFVCFYSVNDS